MRTKSGIEAVKNFNTLSDDALSLILSSVTWRELLNLQSVNKRLLALISSPKYDRLLWQPHFERCFPPGNEFRLKEEANASYKYRFKRSYQALIVACAEDEGALDDASDALRNDRVLVLANVKRRSHALQYASDALQNDREIVLAAVTQNGFALQYASEALRNDRGLVLAAVTECGFALRFASDALRADWGMRLAAYSSIFIPIAKYPAATKAILSALAIAAIALTAVLTAGLSLAVGAGIVAGSAAAGGGLAFFAVHRKLSAEVTACEADIPAIN